MMKKLNYIFFAFILLITFKTNVLADKHCRYTANNRNGVIMVDYTIKDDGKIKNSPVISGYTFFGEKDYEKGNKEDIQNWKRNFKSVEIKGKDYYDQYNDCPPYALVSYSNTGYNLFVSDESHLKDLESAIEGHFPTLKGIEVLEAMESKLIGKRYEVNFHANIDGAQGTMNSVSGIYGEFINLPNNRFSFYGYTPIGWMVYNNGKWLCKNESGNEEYLSNCEEESRVLITKNSNFNIKFSPSDPVIDLYMKWAVSSSISSLTINQYGLGGDICTSKGYIWNETNYGDYCNTDNLTYVGCGDASDIPSQVPGLISFGVNLLKIATPIILIIVSIITLVKALASTKEDEIKKAQSSLVKKIIAAALVFFIVSIVQYVILWVADSTETNSISSCMSCFLNNDCDKNIYYKTKGGIGYQCTYISTGESFDCK